MASTVLYSSLLPAGASHYFQFQTQSHSIDQNEGPKVDWSITRLLLTTLLMNTGAKSPPYRLAYDFKADSTDRSSGQAWYLILKEGKAAKPFILRVWPEPVTNLTWVSATWELTNALKCGKAGHCSVSNLSDQWDNRWYGELKLQKSTLAESVSHWVSPAKVKLQCCCNPQKN